MSIGTFDGYRKLQLNVSARSPALLGLPDNARRGGRLSLLVGSGPALVGNARGAGSNQQKRIGFAYLLG